MPSMVEVECKKCKEPFMARVADRNRGWGKFCSKACKAKEQEKRTGQYSAHLMRKKVQHYRDEFGGIPQFDRNGDYAGFCDPGFDNTSCQNE